MKWVGQNIEQFISRFRQKVYIESGDMEISKVSGQPNLELSAWSTTATAAHAGRIKFLKSGTATIDTYTAGNHTTAGEILGRIEAYGIDDGDGETLSSYIEFANDAVSDADSSPGKIVFATSDADDAGTPTVRLTIDDDGLSTFVGAVSVGGNLTFDSVALTGIQTSSESFVDNDISLMTSAAIDDRINTAVTAEDLDVTSDSGTIDVDLNSETLTIAGGVGIDTSATGTTVTITGEDAVAGNEDANKGIASFSSDDFDTEDGHVQLVNLTTAHLGAATLVVESEGIAGNDNDTTLPTSAAVKDYADTGDAAVASDTLTFTNKTIDADGTGNNISNIDTGNMTAACIVTESETIASNDNDTTLPTSAAVKDYVDAKYSYQYISFSANTNAISSNYYKVPSANGISSYAWNVNTDLDYTSANATDITSADAHITMNYGEATASIPAVSYTHLTLPTILRV